MNLIIFIITTFFIYANEKDVYTFKTKYKVGEMDKYTIEQLLNFEIGGYENQQNHSYLSIEKYLGKDDGLIIIEKTITDMVANSITMGDVSLDHAMLRLVDIPYIVYIDSSGSVENVKTEYLQYEEQVRALEMDMSEIDNYLFPFGKNAVEIKVGDKWTEKVDSLSFFPGDGELENFISFTVEFGLDKIKRKGNRSIAYISSKSNSRCDMIYKQDGKIFEGSMTGTSKGKHQFNIDSNKLLLAKLSMKMNWSVTFEDKTYSSTMHMSTKQKKLK